MARSAHLPTLARLSPAAYNALRPVPLSGIAALAARLHPAFLPRPGPPYTPPAAAAPSEAESSTAQSSTRARRLALVEQALTHPSWYALWDQTREQYPEAFVAAAPPADAAAQQQASASSSSSSSSSLLAAAAAATAASPVGAGKGIVLERSTGGGADNLHAAAAQRDTRVQSLLLASSQYLAAPPTAAAGAGSADAALAQHNASLANLGNSLLGLFASEHLHLRYPNIPTRVLKAALAAYVGPSTSADVAMELGLHGSLVRWDPIRAEPSHELKIDPAQPRTEAGPMALLEDAAALERKRKIDLAIERMNRRRKGFVGADGELKSEDDGSAALRKKDVFASVVRALVAVIYQELGISVARHFVASHFLTRVVALPAFLKFNDPKRVLSSTLEKYNLPRPQSRLVAETGRLSINPVFVVGIWSDKNKIGEGSGTSLRMAEYRAAEDAMRRLYLAEADPSGFQVPSLTMSPGESGAPLLDTASFVSQPLGRSEVVHGSRS